MSFLELCERGEINPQIWKEWLQSNKQEGKTPYELLGLLEVEYEDLSKGIHSIDFYLFKRKYKRYVKNIWAGCYVKFAFEIDANNPHFEFGWVDVVNNEQGFCKVQCDDSFFGTRALTLRTIDVIEILPYKQRPLVYYKTMLCNDCNDCDRMANDFPPNSCKLFEFFNAVLNKQAADKQFILLYTGVLQNQNNNQKQFTHESGNCHKCNGNCSCH